MCNILTVRSRSGVDTRDKPGHDEPDVRMSQGLCDLVLVAQEDDMKHGCLALGVACSLLLSVNLASARGKTAWDGVWGGAWGGTAQTKVVVKGGKVVEYDYNGQPQGYLGKTKISGDTLSFGTPPTFVVSLQKTSDTVANAHYHGPNGEADASLTKQ
jgi:hypothetical protein